MHLGEVLPERPRLRQPKEVQAFPEIPGRHGVLRPEVAHGEAGDDRQVLRVVRREPLERLSLVAHVPEGIQVHHRDRALLPDPHHEAVGEGFPHGHRADPRVRRQPPGDLARGDGPDVPLPHPPDDRPDLLLRHVRAGVHVDRAHGEHGRARHPRIRPGRRRAHEGHGGQDGEDPRGGPPARLREGALSARPFPFLRTARPLPPRFPRPVLWYALYSIIYFDNPRPTGSPRPAPRRHAVEPRGLGKQARLGHPGIVFASRKNTFPARSTR